jgi:hypothetical protein
MRVRIAVLADYASISIGDKLNILGIFSNIVARAEPIVHPQMQLVVQFEFDSVEAGKKDVKIVLQDEDGKDILTVRGEINVPRSPHGGPSMVNQILVLNSTNFPKFGSYEFRVLINDRTEAEIPLTVSRSSEPQPA